jgi:catechol 2,3-dioxygenase-like lactoylglutathione lyase family enzyme
MRIHQLNHVGIDVKDVERSCEFYSDVMRLERIPRPEFDFPGAWFRIVGDMELHIISYCKDPVYGHDRGNHFALLVDELDSWEEHWKSFGLDYVPRRLRPDGVEQMYIKDPDGHVVELFTATSPQAGELEDA